MGFLLTKKEIEVALLYRQGCSRDCIAEDLSMSGYTLTKHLTNIRHKLKAKNSIHLGCMISDYIEEYFSKKKTFFS